MISRNADPDVLDALGFTPLDKAIESSNTPVVAALRSIALHDAAARGDVHAVLCGMAEGCVEVNAKHPTTGQTPLYCAAKIGHAEVSSPYKGGTLRTSQGTRLCFGLAPEYLIPYLASISRFLARRGFAFSRCGPTCQ